MSDWAGVLGVWTWTYYSTETNTENAPKYAFRDPKMKKIWGGTPDFSTMGRDPISHTPPLYTRPTKCKSWIQA